jgi:hypothetical protein
LSFETQKHNHTIGIPELTASELTTPTSSPKEHVEQIFWIQLIRVHSSSTSSTSM